MLIIVHVVISSLLPGPIATSQAQISQKAWLSIFPRLVNGHFCVCFLRKTCCLFCFVGILGSSSDSALCFDAILHSEGKTEVNPGACAGLNLSNLKCRLLHGTEANSVHCFQSHARRFFVFRDGQSNSGISGIEATFYRNQGQIRMARDSGQLWNRYLKD